MDLNNTYELIKNIVNDIKGLADKELATKIMSSLLELQEKLLNFKNEEAKYIEEIEKLKEEIKVLKKDKNINWTTKGYGIYTDESGTEHRYCQHCFEKTGKLYEIPRTPGGGRCPECNNYLNN